MKKLNKKLVGLGGATLLALCSANVSAMDVTVIDDFSTKQGDTLGLYIVNDVTTYSSGSVIGDGILGGERDLSILHTGGSSIASTGASPGAGAGDGAFHYENGSGVSSVAVLQWDGADNSMNLNTMGLGGVDLTNGGSSNVFLNDIVRSDGAFRFALTIWDMDGNFVTALIEGAQHATPATTPLGFKTWDECDATGIGGVICSDAVNGVNMADVGAIELAIIADGSATNDNDLDLQIDGIRVNIPEPSTIALLGAGLIGMGAARRKKATLKA